MHEGVLDRTFDQPAELGAWNDERVDVDAVGVERHHPTPRSCGRRRSRARDRCRTSPTPCRGTGCRTEDREHAAVLLQLRDERVECSGKRPVDGVVGHATPASRTASVAEFGDTRASGVRALTSSERRARSQRLASFLKRSSVGINLPSVECLGSADNRPEEGSTNGLPRTGGAPEARWPHVEQRERSLSIPTEDSHVAGSRDRSLHSGRQRVAGSEALRKKIGLTPKGTYAGGVIYECGFKDSEGNILAVSQRL